MTNPFVVGNQTFTVDGQILWLAVSKVGSPPAWEANANYKLGDVVIPTDPQPSQTNLMFQCVGFLGETGTSAPAFPTTAGQLVIDNQIQWECVNPNVAPPTLPYNEYYLIIPSLTINPAD